MKVVDIGNNIKTKKNYLTLLKKVINIKNFTLEKLV